MKFINFIVVRFAILVGLGILVARYFPVSFSVVPLLCLLCILLAVLWLWAKRQWQLAPWFGLVAYLSFFLVGYGSYQLRLPAFQPHHYSHVIQEKTPQLIQLKIRDELKPERFNQKYIAEVFRYGRAKTSGKIILYIKKDSLTSEFEIDDVMLVSSEMAALRPPLNPHQFDYSEYLRGLEVHHEARISEGEILRHGTGKTTLRGLAERVRRYCIRKLRQSPLQVEERAIVQALVLGQRRDIDQTLYSQYAAAGAVHILAVSGLHVGILFLIFQYLTRPIKRIRYGTIVQAALVIGGLYAYALLAGLSPSVVRAATMFSLFVFARALRRETNSMNTLFISFLVLLIINPLWLFHVGFQMSYLAVFFILWIQPKLFGSWQPKNYVLRKGWAIASVTLAAQLGVVPVSLFYFHQLPGLFLLTNLVVLPLIGLLLGAGLAIVILAAMDWLPDFLALAYNHVVKALNTFIAWVARQDAFLFSEIPFPLWNVLATYIIIVGAVLYWKNRIYKNLILSLAGMLVLCVGLLYDKYERSRTELVIFQQSRKTQMAVNEGTHLKVFGNDTPEGSWEHTYPLKGYLLGKGSPNFQREAVPNVFRYRDKIILVIDSAGVYPTSTRADIVWLTQSPRVHLERIIDSLGPSLIIADGNNYRSFVARWRETCQKKKLPFHHTGTKGAFIIE